MAELGGFWLWIGFALFVVAMLWLDLGVFNRKTHAVSIKESLGWTVAWFSLAMVFMFGIYWYSGANHPAEEKALEFLAGYLIEKSLSVDNLFILLLIFNYFKVDSKYQHKVLFWGIFGALAMRFTLILLGVALISRFEWIIFIFGGFLVFTGVRMAFGREKEFHPDQNPIVLLFKRFFSVTEKYHGDSFFVKQGGKWLATPLFIVVLVVEVTDLIFAIDSIPAVLAITRDTFIVYTSNAFAILGLRSLFFALAGLIELFHYLKYGLAAVLGFIGVKMIIAKYQHISTGFSLLVVAAILVLSIILSLIRPPKEDDGLTALEQSKSE